MAGLKETDHSAFADSLVLGALFIPFLPIVAIAYTSIGTALFSCAADTSLACSPFGIDLNALHGHASTLLQWSIKAVSSGMLLAYICTLALFAQFTTSGFRGRVVRTCAVVMWAGVMPLLLGFADALNRSSGQLCVGGPCTLDTFLPTLGYFGNAFSNWLTNIAVPLGVMSALLVAMTMGYRMLIGRFVSLFSSRD